jgi:tetratricopeptide (TPR) repeat protein
MDDLDRAVVTSKQAIESAPDDHPEHAICLSNLGSALVRRFERTGSMDDLDRAIVTNEQAVESTPDDHPERAIYLNNLGNALRSRFDQTGSTDDLDRAIVTIEQAVESESASPSIRLNAASSCTDLLISQRHAKPILAAAVRLLPMISPRSLKQSDQQYNISQFFNITSRAVSLSLADGDDTFESLQLLELGRGILANLQLEARSDISVLATDHPDLARQFQELRDQIDLPSTALESSLIEDSSVISSLKLSKSIVDRRALFKQFDNLLQHIRSLQGFENFLRGPSKSELYRLAESGPIVVFNVSDLRSDAFLITSYNIFSLHLPLLTSKLKEKTKLMETWLNNSRESVMRDAIPLDLDTAGDELKELLEWLWIGAVSPVLDALRIGIPKDLSHRQRIWWVTSGLLSNFPIHAAGYHNHDSKDNALDRVISSYIPTIKSLGYARDNARDLSTIEGQTALFVSMRDTPGLPSLPGAEEEVEALNKIIPATIPRTVIHSAKTEPNMFQCLTL